MTDWSDYKRAHCIKLDWPGHFDEISLCNKRRSPMSKEAWKFGHLLECETGPLIPFCCLSFISRFSRQAKQEQQDLRADNIQSNNSTSTNLDLCLASNFQKKGQWGKNYLKHIFKVEMKLFCFKHGLGIFPAIFRRRDGNIWTSFDIFLHACHSLSISW